MAAPNFSRLPGFRDFPPEDFAFRQHVFEAWRRVSRRYGFLEYDGPPLEPLDLYVEKSGEEIVGQLYNFVDKGDREITLRPEMTPSLARILGERSRGMSKPIRWFTVPQLFRYERQQRGRLREHFQWNADIVGEDSVAADAEVVALAIDALRELGLTHEDFRARVSDRRLLTAVLREGLGIAEDRLGAAFALIDRFEKLPRELVVERMASEAGLEARAADEAVELFGSLDLDGIAARFGGSENIRGAAAPLSEYVGILGEMGLGDYVQVDLTIVRGLAYYTGIVFELFDTHGELRAICGGGRYDRLLELVGGEPLPAVGFGMGDVVLGELLADRGLVPGYRRAVDYALVTIGAEQRPLAYRLAHQLRERGRSVVFALRDQAVRKQFKAAETEGAARVLVIGPEEATRGTVKVREMTTGAEREVSIADVIAGVGEVASTGGKNADKERDNGDAGAEA
ncbi:MAG: histidine--tRNA ligase [Gemmatimonadetes bacterium]|nr:histidine--tRNA ligase [Gemmatimonadota bacterium]